MVLSIEVESRHLLLHRTCILLLRADSIPPPEMRMAERVDSPLWIFALLE
ncbi:hypothetical protein D187_007681 [Cystobacter fuscus DSM 2262]|uniref:Uncharacterized protein n=1 Tax=Cystobacter fuscus (strain ATCC 25194 / DSM 2262 / NBRC 100088 / M29) TaxID=1242864 RepID=S9Q4R4_CYSF2|nr:hypothetical protein D187_007681 [Cystobacter fuscus DSM 2262]